MGTILDEVLESYRFTRDEGGKMLPECYHEVWKSRWKYDLCSAILREDRTEKTEHDMEEAFNQFLQEKLNKARGEDCFFYPIDAGMSLEAASELERRAVDRREANRDRRHMIKVAWISFGGAVLAAIIVAVLTAYLTAKPSG